MTLNTAEKFLLLAQHPVKGRSVIANPEISYGIAGALLLELTLEERIAIEDKRLILKNDKKSDNPVLSEIITTISGSRKRHRIRYWLERIEGKAFSYKRVIMEGLERKNLIRTEYRKFLGLIPYRRYYLIDSMSRDNLIMQLRGCILYHKDLNNENRLLLGLIKACNMQNIIASDRSEQKSMKKELKEIIKEAPMNEAASQTLYQVQSAILDAIQRSASASFMNTAAAANNY